MWVFVLILGLSASSMFPSVMTKFPENSSIDLYVNKVDSEKTQLPFSYYYLNYCSPSNPSKAPESLGQILRGDRVEKSPYSIHMGIDEPCA